MAQAPGFSDAASWARVLLVSGSAAPTTPLQTIWTAPEKTLTFTKSAPLRGGCCRSPLFASPPDDRVNDADGRKQRQKKSQSNNNPIGRPRQEPIGRCAFAP